MYHPTDVLSSFRTAGESRSRHYFHEQERVQQCCQLAHAFTQRGHERTIPPVKGIDATRRARAELIAKINRQCSHYVDVVP